MQGFRDLHSRPIGTTFRPQFVLHGDMDPFGSGFSIWRFLGPRGCRRCRFQGRGFSGFGVWGECWGLDNPVYLEDQGT